MTRHPVGSIKLAIRLGFFFGKFALMAIWEIYSPRRRLSISKAVRWVSNLALVVLNSIVLRLLFPTAAVGVSIVVQQKSWGLFNQFELPAAISIILCVVALDFVIYLQHVMVHYVRFSGGYTGYTMPNSIMT